MTPARGGLGRGLGALLPLSGESVEQVDIDLVAPNPDQPRRHLDQESLEGLSRSISEHGILQPLIVTRQATDAGAITYTLIAGERRLRAARMAGLQRVPAIVRDVHEVQRLELALVENLQRADLTPIEEAEAYRRLIDEFGLTQDEAGRRVGRGRVAVANAIRLLGLSPAIKASLEQGEITAGHARALLSASSEADRLVLLDRIRQQGLNVRRTEELARGQSGRPNATAHRPRHDPDLERVALQDRLQAALSTRVDVQPARRGGRIVIRYYDDDDLGEIVAMLLRGRDAAD